MDSEQIQTAMKELQDAMVVMAHMEARQTDRLLRQEKEIEDLSLSRARVDQTVHEITDKLNGLIGYVGGQNPGEGSKR
jgi:GTP cyclohydrolase III